MKTITQEGGQILGCFEWTFGVNRKFGTGERRLDDVYANGARSKAADPEERDVLSIASAWGFGVVNVTAERVFVRGLPLAG